MNKKGFFIMGPYTTLAWRATRAAAEAELARILARGDWSGVRPYIVEA
jgi:hypothetical protein